MPLFLDTGVLGLVTHPQGDAGATQCHKWLKGCIAAGSTFCVPEIADYELRRELIRRKNNASIGRLDSMTQQIARYIPLTTVAMRRAAQLWAQMRSQGTPTAAHHALDGDVILAAQASEFTALTGKNVIVVTTDVGDLSRLATAARWEDLPVGCY
jgi:predicted nucleic acid-binding protein